MRVSRFPGVVAICLITASLATAAEKQRALPMYARADVIDAGGKTFTHKTKDGREVKHVLAPSADVRNNGKTAKFEEIQIGDMVSGSRIKKSPTEYEVQKITKFGPAQKKVKDPAE